jgi:signal transduction histidine kinase
LDQYRDEHLHPERFYNQGWKFHSGDNLEWKNPSFSDSSWTILSTNFRIDSIPENQWQGIGWFRLKLIIDPSLRNNALAMVMTHYGASEVYLDGKLINQFGIPGKHQLVEKTFRPLFGYPIILPLDNNVEHILAVRYSFLNAEKLFKKYGGILWRINGQHGSAGFFVHFAEPRQAINLYGESLKKNLMLGMITLTILLLIGTFHLFLYWFYSRNRSNLYITFFILVLAGHSFTKFLPTYTSLSLETLILINCLNVIFRSLWIPASMLAYYSAFYSKLPKHVWLYFIFTAQNLLTTIFTFRIGIWVGLELLFSSIAFLDMLRLLFLSRVMKDKYVWMLGIGVLLSQFALILYLFPSMSQYKFFLMFPVFLAVPLSLSLFNALHTAQTSKKLEKQLVEVKRLSQLSLLQEQEKQEILAEQNEVLERQVEERTSELKESLEGLKSTQAQLIQAEKMASLGELTAGIAHEIQNPLNFVNNFSDVNAELISEMEKEMDKGNLIDAKAIARDIKENEKKIKHHGKRADAIVKGMLQHSRSGNALKEATDINKLADEYLRLAYHGIRGKGSSFNVNLKTDFDPTIRSLNIIPQDIGRVLLNLYNNAFYAIAEKKNKHPEDYEPTVLVTTKNMSLHAAVIIKDNGNGIPEKELRKIFQPFFTTKPTGQGTGLGLSLAYDIVKAHGGEIKVQSTEGDGAEFTVQLPLT